MTAEMSAAKTLEGKAVAPSWPPTPGQWTDADWQRLLAYDQRYEVIKGVVYGVHPPTPRHQAISRTLMYCLQSFTESYALGEVYYAPVHVLLPCPESLVQPDLLFISKTRLDIVHPGEGIYGAPDLIIEVLSPSDWRKDREEKFALYAETGVREYWMVDPKRSHIEVYILRDGQYELLGQWGSGEQARSEVLSGFEVRVDEVFNIVNAANQEGGRR